MSARSSGEEKEEKEANTELNAEEAKAEKTSAEPTAKHAEKTSAEPTAEQAEKTNAEPTAEQVEKTNAGTRPYTQRVEGKGSWGVQPPTTAARTTQANCMRTPRNRSCGARAPTSIRLP